MLQAHEAHQQIHQALRQQSHYSEVLRPAHLHPQLSRGQH